MNWCFWRVQPGVLTLQQATGIIYIYIYIHLYYVYHIYILCIYTHEAVMCNSQAKETKPRPNSRGLAWISATHWLLRYSECCYRMEPQT